jgi:gluconokinase
LDCVLTLDLGSSSARALLFSFNGTQIEGIGSHVEYQPHTTGDGGWEIDTGELTGIVGRTLDEICRQMREAGVKPAAVAIATFWHSVLGIDEHCQPATPVLHPFDTRSAAAARQLAERVDNRMQHNRTGCMLHPSYVPAKLLWLAEAQPDQFRRTRRWVSVGEYLMLKFCGNAAASTSMVSASGFWNQNLNDYDAELLAAVGVTAGQFVPADQLDQPCPGDCEWPELKGIPWYPALGDGACDNAGSGCTTPQRFALMVGTSGAMRAITEADRIEIPPGVFCYRLDRRRFVIGGALSNGGAVYAWMKRTLRLPDDDQVIEHQLAALAPDQTGLTMLPLFAGERSPGWQAETRAVIAGLSASSSPIEILYAALESVALRFRQVYDIMESALGRPREIVASGGALIHSTVWTQIMADAMGRPIQKCPAPEATSRGAALATLERLGAIRSIHDVPPEQGVRIDPRAGPSRSYATALERQRELYRRLYGEPA